MRSIKLVSFGIMLTIVGVTSPLYVMLLTADDGTSAPAEVPLIRPAEDTSAKCLQGKLGITVPGGGLFWQDAMLCGKDMRYRMEGEPPGPIINKPKQDFN